MSEKLASVLERIQAMAADPICAEEEGTLPKPTPEQVSEFRNIVYDLANVIFEPDYTGSNILDIVVSDTRRYTSHVFYEERKDIFSITNEGDFMRAFSDASRTATRMISTGNRIIEMMASASEFRSSTIKKAEETTNDFENLRGLLDAGKLGEFRTEADRLMEKYDPPRYAGDGEDKTPYNRQGNYRKVPDELMLLIDDYGLKLPEHDIDKAIAEIGSLLDVAETRVGVDHRKNGYEGSFDEAISAVREGIYQHQYRIGRRALAPVNVRYNRMSEEHRVIKRLAERGKVVVSEENA